MVDIEKHLAPKIRARFGDRPIGEARGTEYMAIFRCIHPGFGDIYVSDGREEITIFVGNFTHVHLTSGGLSLSSSTSRKTTTPKRSPRKPWTSWSRCSPMKWRSGAGRRASAEVALRGPSGAGSSAERSFVRSRVTSGPVLSTCELRPLRAGAKQAEPRTGTADDPGESRVDHVELSCIARPGQDRDSPHARSRHARDGQVGSVANVP